MSAQRETAYETPDTLSGVHALLDEHGSSAKLLAGGQSVMLLLRQGFLDPDVFVDISRVPGLSGVSTEDGVVTVGAATTYSALEETREINRHPVLADALHAIADRQVRNLGTIGGALGHADPSLDIVPPLRCLDAEVTVSSSAGARTLPLGEFHRGYMEADLEPGELIESVSFARVDGTWVGGAYEKHANVEGGWPTVGVAAQVDLDADDGVFSAVRVALAAVADTAVRTPSVENALTGQPISSNAIEQVAGRVTDDIDPIDDLSGSAAYKERLAEALTRRAISHATERAGGEL